MKVALSVAAALALAWALQLGLLVYAGYVALGLIALSRLFASVWVRAVDAQRAPVTLKHEIGDKISIELQFENKSGLGVPWLLAEDFTLQNDFTSRPQKLSIRGETRKIFSLKAREEAFFGYEVELLRRGCYQFGPLLVETGDLFGLHRDFRILTEAAMVVVYPKILPLDGYDIESARPMGEIRLTNRLFDDPTRILGIKPHERGEPLNRIHWRATARTGELQSKVYESTSVAGATIVLDFSHEAFPKPGEYYASELAITLAGSIAQMLTHLNQQVGFATNGGDGLERLSARAEELRFKTRSVAKHALRAGIGRMLPQAVMVETRRDVEQFDRILEQLARLELSDEFPLAAMLGQAASRFPRSATVLAILGRVTEETALALGALKQRGYSVTAILVSGAEDANPIWAAKPEWAAHLLERDIPFRVVTDEAGAQRVCSPQGLGELNCHA